MQFRLSFQLPEGDGIGIPDFQNFTIFQENFPVSNQRKKGLSIIADFYDQKAQEFRQEADKISGTEKRRPSIHDFPELCKLHLPKKDS